MEIPKPYKVFVPTHVPENGDLLGEYFKDTSALPRRVDSNPLNRLLLLPQALVHRDFNLVSSVVAPGDGKYIGRANIYLLPTGSRRFAQLHEETHGLAYAMDPDAGTLTFRSMRGALSRGDREYIPRLVGHYSLHEGVANYVAIDIAMQSSDRNLYYDGDLMRKNLLYGKNQEGTTDDYKKTITSVFEILTTAEGCAMPLLDREDIPLVESVKLSADIIRMIMIGGYLAGYYFVTQVVSRMAARGIDKKDSLELLTKNPPLGVNELIDTPGYVEKVLNKGGSNSV